MIPVIAALVIQYFALFLECSGHSVYVCRTMATPKDIQKDYEAFLEDILRRLLLLEKDIHILLIAHRKTVKFDFDRLLTRKELPQSSAVPSATSTAFLRSATSAKSISMNPALVASPPPTSAGATSWTIGSSGTHTTPGSESQWQTQIL